LSYNFPNDIPGFKNLPTRERLRLYVKAYLRAFRYRQTWLSILIVFVLAAIGERWGGKWGESLARALGMGIFCAVVTERARQLLRDELRKR
jgi:hypothetical protein